MKFGQILLYCMTSISNIFFAECWRLETSSRLLCDFIKITIQPDLTIFHGSHIPFLIALYSTFQKNGAPQSWPIPLLSIAAVNLIKKDLESSPIPPNFSEDYWTLLPLLISINWPSLVTSWVVVQKIYSSWHHRFGKLWDSISWERNIIFLWNKKKFNLCFRWHILRSYRFIVR